MSRGVALARRVPDDRFPVSRARGIVLVTVGALCLVPDATLVRLADAPDFRIVFWRTLGIGVALAGVVLQRHRGAVVHAYRAVGRVGVAVSVLWGFALVLFVYSINHTAVANALVVIATAPFLAAFFTWLLVAEPIATRTWWAMAATLGGIALTFAGALQLGGWSGNVAALGVAAALGLNLTLIRRAGDLDMLPAISIAGFVAALVSLPAAWPIGVSLHDLVVIGAMGLVLVPAAFTLVTLGARHLPSPEVTLLMTLETVLGPVLAWAVIGESPPPFAVAGGAVVVVTLLLHSVRSLSGDVAGAATVGRR